MRCEHTLTISLPTTHAKISTPFITPLKKNDSLIAVLHGTSFKVPTTSMRQNSKEEGRVKQRDGRVQPCRETPHEGLSPVCASERQSFSLPYFQEKPPTHRQCNSASSHMPTTHSSTTGSHAWSRYTSGSPPPRREAGGMISGGRRRPVVAS